MEDKTLTKANTLLSVTVFECRARFFRNDAPKNVVSKENSIATKRPLQKTFLK